MSMRKQQQNHQQQQNQQQQQQNQQQQKINYVLEKYTIDLKSLIALQDNELL